MYFSQLALTRFTACPAGRDCSIREFEIRDLKYLTIPDSMCNSQLILKRKSSVGEGIV